MQDASTPAEACGGPRRKGFLGRFLRDRSGATAIEFTALAIPFTLLVFAILESCISFAGQEVLANATDDVARLFRTGQIKKADNVTEAKLKQMICERIDVIVAENCPGLIVDLRHFNTFREASDASFAIVSGKVVLRNNGQPDQFKVDLGASMSKNMLRVFYQWPVMTDFLAKYMANLEGNKTLHFATVTWQNEPFDD